METFAALCAALDETTGANDKLDALGRYFAAAPPADAAWALFFLSGRRLPQPVPARLLRQWAADEAAVPAWLFAECYAAVGDLAETIALLVEQQAQSTEHRAQSADAVSNDSSSFILHPSSLQEWVEQRLLPLRGAGENTQRAAVAAAWRALDERGRFVWNKLLTGALRVGVAQSLLARALAQVGGVEPATIVHRLAGAWSPTPAFFARLLAADSADAAASQPYPFCLAFALDDPPEALGLIAEWQAEWKWDGARVQLVRRQGQTFLWSRGEELLTEHFPELAALGASLPDGTVIDGEILPWRDGAPLPGALLQQRIGRKSPSKKLLAEVPAVLLAYDLLEEDGADIRTLPLHERRARLGTLLSAERKAQSAELNAQEGPAVVADTGHIDGALRSSLSALRSCRLSPLAPAANWEDLATLWATARERGAEGLVLRRRSSAYHAGRERGDWWTWKVAPHSVVAVLLYAQRGTGMRASLYSDYTFGLWHNGQLVPFAKAYAGLSDAEIRKVDAFVRRNTLEKFGPVRTVRPELVFELAFEGIQRSPRHKSGIAVRAPRILRWRTDKSPAEADTLETIRALLPAE